MAAFRPLILGDKKTARDKIARRLLFLNARQFVPGR